MSDVGLVRLGGSAPMAASGRGGGAEELGLQFTEVIDIRQEQGI